MSIISVAEDCSELENIEQVLLCNGWEVDGVGLGTVEYIKNCKDVREELRDLFGEEWEYNIEIIDEDNDKCRHCGRETEDGSGVCDKCYKQYK